MALLSYETLMSYWSIPFVEANIIVFCNLSGSLLLGLLLGFERSYRRRAAGMRTYGLVCLSSTALIVIIGYPEYWFAGHAQFTNAPDVTRVIQGIVTGIGFLGAGVIIKEGFSISGLTTAASIWTASAVGILVGVGFYFSAILLTFLSMMVMMWGYKLEISLPSRRAVLLTLSFKTGFGPELADLKTLFLTHEYTIAKGSLIITSTRAAQEWSFTLIARKTRPTYGIPELSKLISTMKGIENYHISFARN